MCFDFMMSLRSIEIHNITLKTLALFRPKLHDSYSSNQIARCDREECCQIFKLNDAVD